MPIDERAVLSVRRAGVEPAIPKAAGLQAVGLANAQPTHVFKWRRRSRTRRSPRFELGRFADLRTAPYSKAPSTGFGPAISCVTGRRALQAAPRGHDRYSGSGGSRTHSIPGSKPRWSAGCLPSRQCPERESNPQTLGFKPSRSASLAYLGRSSPGRTRTADRHLVRVLPSPLGYRTVLFQWSHRESHPDLQRAELASSCWTMTPMSRHKRKPCGTRTHKRACTYKLAATCFQDRLLIRPDGFRGQAAEAGIEPT